MGLVHEQLTTPAMLEQAYTSYCRDIEALYGNTDDELQAVESALAEAKAQEECYMEAVGSLPVGNALRVEYMKRAEEAHEKVLSRSAAREEMQSRHLNYERNKRGFKAFVDVAPQA